MPLFHLQTFWEYIQRVFLGTLAMMTSRDIAQAICFLAQTGVGVMGNSLLITLHISMFLLNHKTKPTDLIILHLALVHAMMLLTRGVTVGASLLGHRLIQSDIGCKTFAYVYRVSRGLSICTTALLNAVQAVTISPRSSPWAQLKVSTPKCILSICVFSWLVNPLISRNLLLQVNSSPNMTMWGPRFHDNDCSITSIGTALQGFCLALMILRDGTSLGLMSHASAHIVLFLYRHGQRVQYLHTSNLPGQAAPERRATQSILLLLSCFVTFYCVDFLFSCFLGTSLKNNFILNNANTFVVSGYATISPFVLLQSNPGIIKFLLHFLPKKSPHGPQVATTETLVSMILEMNMSNKH
ncbi:putative vomeronasal receptor-like protein 4 [Tachyglossus aculeatus]|uniref:putative vomeronasal receptor-like protein 4 n=1 Tax=Tachyglossus aculeatus TaxID=9261 RepID=UPI0018F3BF6D|nr:putative vomeronasal receptor-like protein 4 [Tachyglossus aculeatus]